MSSPLSSTHHTRPASTNHLLTALNLLILCISCLSPLLCLSLSLSLSLPLLRFFLFPLYHGDSLRCLSGKAALFLRHHHHHHHLVLCSRSLALLVLLDCFCDRPACSSCQSESSANPCRARTEEAGASMASSRVYRVFDLSSATRALR